MYLMIKLTLSERQTRLVAFVCSYSRRELRKALWLPSRHGAAHRGRLFLRDGHELGQGRSILRLSRTRNVVSARRKGKAKVRTPFAHERSASSIVCSTSITRTHRVLFLTLWLSTTLSKSTLSRTRSPTAPARQRIVAEP